MRLISNKKIIDFSMLYPDSLRPLQSWRRLIECRSYENFSQLKSIFGSIDKVGDLMSAVIDTDSSPVLAFRNRFASSSKF